MKHIGLNWIAIALLSLTLAACASPLASVTPSTTPAGEIDSLEEARAAWSSSGINNYDFTITRQCFCIEEYAGPCTVRVRDGISTVTRSSDGSEVDPLILNLLPLSAEELFQFAEERQDQASFRVPSEPAPGLPLRVWSDPIPEAADDELGVLVSGFTAAP